MDNYSADKDLKDILSKFLSYGLCDSNYHSTLTGNCIYAYNKSDRKLTILDHSWKLYFFNQLPDELDKALDRVDKILNYTKSEILSNHCYGCMSPAISVKEYESSLIKILTVGNDELWTKLSNQVNQILPSLEAASPREIYDACVKSYKELTSNQG